ncbi:MAG: hypothetical protein ABI882_22410 [Acidobacteriota bacterium]
MNIRSAAGVMAITGLLVVSPLNLAPGWPPNYPIDGVFANGVIRTSSPLNKIHEDAQRTQQLDQALGPARPQAIVLTPIHRIPVQTNGFARNDIETRYRVRLQWIDAAWDGAIAAYRREYGERERLPSPRIISRVTILPTLGYTSNSLDMGATYYKSRVDVRNYSVEATVYYRSSDGRETSLCDGGVEEEFIKAIGHWKRLPCFAQLNNQANLRCGQLSGSLLTPMCR